MLLTTVWFLGRRVVIGTLLFMAVVYAVTAVLLGHDVGPSVWMAVLSALQPWLMGWLYHQPPRAQGLDPERHVEVAALLYATLVSSVLLAACGGLPGLGASDLSGALPWWWVLRNT